MEPVVEQRRKAKLVGKEFGSVMKFKTKAQWQPFIQKFLDTIYSPKEEPMNGLKEIIEKDIDKCLRYEVTPQTYLQPLLADMLDCN